MGRKQDDYELWFAVIFFIVGIFAIAQAPTNTSNIEGGVILMGFGASINSQLRGWLVEGGKLLINQVRGKNDKTNQKMASSKMGVQMSKVKNTVVNYNVTNVAKRRTKRKSK